MLSTTFLPFALFDSNDHSFAIDVGDFQAGSLRNAQSRSVAGRQDRAMLDALNEAYELQYFFGTQDNRQRLRLLGRRDDVFETPIPMKCDFVKKTQGRDGGQDGTDNQLLFVG